MRKLVLTFERRAPAANDLVIIGDPDVSSLKVFGWEASTLGRSYEMDRWCLERVGEMEE